MDVVYNDVVGWKVFILGRTNKVSLTEAGAWFSRQNTATKMDETQKMFEEFVSNFFYLLRKI